MPDSGSPTPPADSPADPPADPNAAEASESTSHDSTSHDSTSHDSAFPDAAPPADLFSSAADIQAPEAGDARETAAANPQTRDASAEEDGEADDAAPAAAADSDGEHRRAYSIGEVADRVDLEAHVLRYWETEFPQLQPPKDAAGRRVYRRVDIRTVERIRHLLKEEKYTIAGARAVLEREGIHGRKAFRDELRDVRTFLVRLRDEL
jgi:DNA-binding transcriptional MerR regulator